VRKLFIILSVFIVASAVVGCGDDYRYVKFETSQPENVTPKKAFKKNVQATYTNCYNTNEQLVITDKLIFNTQIIKIKTHRNDFEFDSTVVIDVQNNTQLIEMLEQNGWSVTVTGDTVLSSIQVNDTVFKISQSNVLKRLKGSYFLNYKKAESNWDVKRMDFKKDTLFVGEITPSDTLLQYDFISKIEELDETDSTKTIEYIANPSKREFKKLLKPNSFRKTKCYYKN
jgi:hypothetical protein